eukprot:s212_g2.t1
MKMSKECATTLSNRKISAAVESDDEDVKGVRDDTEQQEDLRRSAQSDDEDGKAMHDGTDQQEVLVAAHNLTTRMTMNANSSRFGKWLDLRFSEGLAMRGCRITSYLLEVTRVCGQAPGERGFHVFYQLLEARSDPALQLLALRGAESYRYLRHSPRTSAGDSADFCELRNAFLSLGFDAAQQFEVFQLLAGILELGNCEIIGGSEDDEVPFSGSATKL